MDAYTPELEPEVKERIMLVQQVIDRLVDPTNEYYFKFQLGKLLAEYPANERPLDYTVPNLILMNGEKKKVTT